MAELEIRPAPRALKQKIEDLSRVTFEEHRARQPWAFPDNAYEFLVRPTIEGAFRDKGKPVDISPSAFVALRNGDLAGFIILSEWARPGGAEMPFVSIDDIHVAEKHRGQGIGRALVAHVRNLASERDWDSLVATVWTGNEASRAMFEAEGFSPDYVRMRYGPNRKGRNYPVPPTLRPQLWIYGILAFSLVLGFIAMGIALTK